MSVLIRSFEPGDEIAFRDINLQWIRQFFAVEAKDLEVLGDPQTHILEPGGDILVALEDGVALGTVALVVIGAQAGEIAKMGVRPEAQGKGIGRRLLAAAIARAQDLGMSRLYIETNSKLAPALKLYRDAGFQPLARPVPTPYARADVQLELVLQRAAAQT